MERCKLPYEGGLERGGACTLLCSRKIGVIGDSSLSHVSYLHRDGPGQLLGCRHCESSLLILEKQQHPSKTARRLVYDLARYWRPPVLVRIRQSHWRLQAPDPGGSRDDHLQGLSLRPALSAAAPQSLDAVAEPHVSYPEAEMGSGWTESRSKDTVRDISCRCLGLRVN